MDSVRFGRALGIGARSAAKALAGAVDAAAAPNPVKRQAIPPATQSRTSVRPETHARPVPGPIAYTAKVAASATIQADAARKRIARGSKRFSESAWGPFARLSGVLWLEITGSFFAIFALFAGSAVWSHRADLKAGLNFRLHSTPASHDAGLHLLVFVAMTLLFAYFSISSFVRAYRK